MQLGQVSEMMSFSMNPKLQKRLEARGWKVGSVEEFLGLTEVESAHIELKLILSEKLNARRLKENQKRTQSRKVTAKLFLRSLCPAHGTPLREILYCF